MPYYQNQHKTPMKGFYSPEEQGTWGVTEEQEAAALEITVDELRQRKSNPVPLKKLPYQRLHGH